MRNTLRSAALLASTIFFSLVAAQTSSRACNNSALLCDRTYSNITHLGAHNSAFVRDETTRFSTSGNHFYNSTVQLAAGVRMLTAQVHRFNDTATGAVGWHLCHSDCRLLDAGLLRDWLRAIDGWMVQNPNEVVSILLVNSDNAGAADLDAEFRASGVTQHAYTPAVKGAGSPWPTLGEMIDKRQRLVTFIAALSDNAAAPYLLNQYEYTFENSFDNKSPSSFSCTPSRPADVRNDPAAATASGRLFVQNHFLYDAQLFGIEIPDVNNLNTTNAVNLAENSLGTRIAACTETYGRIPSFVMVDFFNVGPAIQSVDIANGVTQPVGRMAVSTEMLTPGSRGGAGSVGISSLVLVLGSAISLIASVF